MNKNIRTFWLSLLCLLLAAVSFWCFFAIGFWKIRFLGGKFSDLYGYLFYSAPFGAFLAGIIGAWLLLRGKRGMAIVEKMMLAVVVGLGAGPILVFSWYSIEHYWRHASCKEEKATMMAIKAVATAWESYFQDHRTYCMPGQEAEQFRWGNMDPRDLGKALAPYREKYVLNEYSLIDGWGNPMQFAVARVDPTRSWWTRDPVMYAIRSSGEDGRWESDYYWSRPVDHGRDLVLACGQFIQWPVGCSKEPCKVDDSVPRSQNRERRFP